MGSTRWATDVLACQIDFSQSAGRSDSAAASLCNQLKKQTQRMKRLKQRVGHRKDAR